VRGQVLISLIVGFTVTFSAILFYFQVYAYYYRVSDVHMVLVGDKNIRVKEYQGIDAETSGLKLRGCFTSDLIAYQGLKKKTNPTPLSAPFWFDCFNYIKLQEDLDSGLASAYIGAKEEKVGMDRIVAVYPDGRSFQWRQLSDRYSN
jgi:hypothetical protein